MNVTNAAIMKALHDATGCSIEWTPDARPVAAPAIAIERLREEFDYAPRQLPEQLPSLIALYRERYGQAAMQTGAGA